MKIFRRKWFLILLVLLLLLAVYFMCNPFLRVKTFIYLNSGQIEKALLNGNGVPNVVGVDAFNTWEGEHTMTEFILFTVGDTYYGCYYSYDDVPLAFQNTNAELVQNGHVYWKWKGIGDNSGATQRILDNWFYFEASF